MTNEGFYEAMLCGELADVNPLLSLRILKELIQAELYGAVCTADSGKDCLKTLEAFIQINGNAVVNSKGTYPADRMADKRENFISGEHLRLEMEELFELVIINPRISGGKDQHTAGIGLERERLCNTGAVNAEGEGGKFYRGGRDVKLADAILHAQSAEKRPAFFY